MLGNESKSKPQRFLSVLVVKPLWCPSFVWEDLACLEGKDSGKG